MYVFLLCWWVAIIQPERSVILEVRILLESEDIAMLQVFYTNIDCKYLQLLRSRRTFVDSFSVGAFFFTLFVSVWGPSRAGRPPSPDSVAS